MIPTFRRETVENMVPWYALQKIKVLFANYKCSWTLGQLCQIHISKDKTKLEDSWEAEMSLDFCHI